MKNSDIVRAWDYRVALGEKKLSGIPNSPAGAIELSDLDLEDIAGGKRTWPPRT